MSTLKQALSETPRPYEKRWYPSSDPPAVGVLLTEDQAREALAAIEQRDELVEALVSQAKRTCKAEAIGAKGKYADIVANAHWQKYLTDHARAVLVKAGKITE